MKDMRALEDKIKLLEKELADLTERFDKLSASVGELDEFKLELRAFKLFAGRHHPEFKTEIQELVKKLRSGPQ